MTAYPCPDCGNIVTGPHCDYRYCVARLRNTAKKVKPKKRDPLDEAQEMYVNAHVLAGIVAILEGGVLYGRHSAKVIQRLLAIANKEQGRLFKAWAKKRRQPWP